MARALNAGYEGTSVALRPALPGSDGRTRTAYSASLCALRPACLAVQGEPTRHVCAHQPECELRRLRICSAGKTNQVDARALIPEPIRRVPHTPAYPMRMPADDVIAAFSVPA